MIRSQMFIYCLWMRVNVFFLENGRCGRLLAFLLLLKKWQEIEIHFFVDEISQLNYVFHLLPHFTALLML